MRSSKKFTAAAGMLGCLALIGIGTGQAYGAGEPKTTCVKDGKGTVRCQQKSEHRYTTADGSTVNVYSEQTCTSHEVIRKPFNLTIDGEDVKSSSKGTACKQTYP